MLEKDLDENDLILTAQQMVYDDEGAHSIVFVGNPENGLSFAAMVGDERVAATTIAVSIISNDVVRNIIKTALKIADEHK